MHVQCKKKAQLRSSNVFVFLDMWTCEDIDECAEGLDICDENAWCNNTYGDYECYCNDGYFGDGFACGDSDECAEAEEAGVINNVTDHLYDSNSCSSEGPG